MTRTFASLLAAVFIAGGTSLAHPGHTHKVLGTVSVVHENHLEVKNVEGKAITLTVNDKTKIWRNKAPMRIADVKVGERVSVTYEESKDKAGQITMVVKMIQLGVTPAPAKSGVKQ